MSWAVGYDSKWKRDIGYGVPTICDHPECGKEIDRGLAHVCCGGVPYGDDEEGSTGCGLFFCGDHSDWNRKCERCENGLEPFTPKPDVPEWVNHKLTDESWSTWRMENNIPEQIQKTLTLPLKRKWFEEIKAGTKTEEYRLVNDYWAKRLIDRHYDNVVFTLGYPKRDDMDRRLKAIYRGYIIKVIVSAEWNNDAKTVFAIQFELVE